MQYRTFKLSEESAINEFLKANREFIGRDQVNIGDERISFIVIDPFDAELATKIHKRAVWQKQHQKVCEDIADCEAKLKEWEGLPDDQKVGERPLAQRIGNTQSFENISA